MDYKLWLDPRHGGLKVILADEYEVVCGFLEDEVRSHYSVEKILEKITTAYHDENYYYDFVGNAYGAEIRKETTRVYCWILEEDVKKGIKVTDQVESSLRTVDFEYLVKRWFDDLEDFRNGKIHIRN
jgi:uncharacterized protein YacL (UPF0231 family)